MPISNKLAYELRPITLADNQAIKALIKTVLTEFGATGTGFAGADQELNDMYHAYLNKGCVYYVVLIDGRLVGGGGIAPLQGLEPTPGHSIDPMPCIGPIEGAVPSVSTAFNTALVSICELRKMYFHPEARGLGLGKQLLSHCLSVARAIGYQTVYLETLHNMKAAQQLYRRFGFQPLAQPWGNTGHHGCDLWYALSLS